MTDILSIGRSGLAASKKSLEVAGHNISNANTEGYSRQRVRQTSGIPLIKDGMIASTGTRILGTERIDAGLLEKRLQSSLSENEYQKERLNQLEQVEHIFNESGVDGLNKIINRFFNSFRELANQPENETIRSVVRDSARMITKDFRRIRGTLDSLAYNIDKKLEHEIVNINQSLNQIAKLNQKIRSLEAIGGESGDLRDQRDIALKSLSEYFQITTYLDNRNNFVVNAEGVGTLVSATEVQELAFRGQDKDSSSNGMSGSVEIYFKNRPASHISEKFQNGRITSLLTARNSDIQRLQKEVDEIAFNLTKGVNAIHSRGHAFKHTIQIEGEDPNKNTGILFFKDLSNGENAGNEIALSSDVENDLTNIVTALEPNNPGDNRIALAISKLESAKILANGTATFEEQYLKSIGNIGLQTGKARLDTEQSQGLLAQTKSLKERITGVSIDEEAANMIKFQQAYEASAKVLKAADDMFQVVLGIKR